MIFQPIHQIYWAQTFVSVVSRFRPTLHEHVQSQVLTSAQLIIAFGMDMSFPAATVIISNQMPPEHQGIAASLIVTVVNYAIALGLGIAGTVESVVVVHEKTPSFYGNVKGIRAGFYTGLVLSGLGVILAVLFFIATMRKYLKEVRR
jgi:MFS family permease